MKRADFLKTLAVLPLTPSVMNLNDLQNITNEFKTTEQLPVMFIGHGSPMNAIADNAFTKSLSRTGNNLPFKPTAILVISAHWLTRGTHVLTSAKPRIIYDFGGFPEELYKVQYPSPGAPQFANEAKQLLAQTSVVDDNQWGFDHGAWTVLKHMFPEANIPVFELSIDATKPPEYHFELAKQLKALRNKGVLIIGSGNIVHNLYQVSFDNNAKPYDWAIEFDEKVKSLLMKRDFDALINYKTLGQSAQLSIPTNDHYLPMLYSLGLTDNNDELQFTFEEIQNASISMRCFQYSQH
jgi:4,5-DOPA dioxygenase extradiol